MHLTAKHKPARVAPLRALTFATEPAAQYGIGLNAGVRFSEEDMSEDEPWWWPQIIDDAHLAELRDEYPQKAGMDDDSLLDYFDDGKDKGGFSTTWDHLGDAYADYEKIARAFLKLVEETGKVPSDFSKI